MKTGILIFAHGSTIEEANAAVRRVAAEVAREGGYEMVETAFLDCAPPSLAAAVDGMTQRGATRLIVVPYFLTPGAHLQRDLPRLVAEARSAHPHLRIEVTAPLDGHPLLRDIVLDRAREAV